MAGLLRPPLEIKEIEEWLTTTSNWVVILLGYNINLKNDLILIPLNYIEYEDIVKFADFFISNCGSGSVVAGMANGVPQGCSIISDRHFHGKDKVDNLVAISEYQLSPVKNFRSLLNHDEFSLTELMRDVDKHFQTISINAAKISSEIKVESELQMRNMNEFFYALTTSQFLQDEMIQTGKIPEIFALPDCRQSRNFSLTQVIVNYDIPYVINHH